MTDLTIPVARLVYAIGGSLCLLSFFSRGVLIGTAVFTLLIAVILTIAGYD